MIMTVQKMKRDLTTMLDVQKDILDILETAEVMKKKRDLDFQPLKGKVLAMIFEKSSTRTRVSFEVGMIELGGFAVTLNTKDLQMGRGETVADTARVLSRYVDGIMYRAYEHEMVMELAKHATVPVINGLDNFEHPCQIMADLLTVKEHLGKLKGIKTGLRRRRQQRVQLAHARLRHGRNGPLLRLPQGLRARSRCPEEGKGHREKEQKPA